MKKLLTRLFDNKSELSLQQRKRLAAWRRLPPATVSTPINKMRCVVMDVESSGLDLKKDRLISIGAIALVNGQLALGDYFYAVLQQPTASDKENILLHGISGSDQMEGVPAIDALLDFLEFLGRDPLVAFHVAFDKHMITQAIDQYLNFKFKRQWLDLAYIMPALNPDLAENCRSLDEWSNCFNLENETRHNALADAIVTAELLQVALHQGSKRSIAHYSKFLSLEKSLRWLTNQGDY